MDRTDKPWEGALFKVSPYNYIPEVQKQYNFREPMVLQDFTLGKMDHLEGTRMYSPGEYAEIAQLLDEIGVQETFFLIDQYPGTARGDRVWEGIEAIAKLGLKMRLRLWGHSGNWAPGTYKNWVDKMADYGATSIGLSAFLPFIIQQTMTPKAGSKAEQKVDELPDAIEYAREKGLTACVGHLFVGANEDMQSIIDRGNSYIDAGAESILIPDSKAIANPEATRYFVSKVRAGLKKDVPLYYHVHDCFGLATAQALAAASAGAYPQVSVNGIADMGFASLEEVALSMELLYGVQTGINFRLMPELSRTVERITGISNPPYKAVTGPFNAMSGLVPAYLGMLSGKDFRELNVNTPFEPELVGLRSQLMMSYLGLSNETVEAKLNQMGLPSGEREVVKVREALKERLDSFGNKFPVMLNDVEVEQVCRETLGK